MPVIRKSLTLASICAFLLVAGIFSILCFKYLRREIAEILFLIIILFGLSLCGGSVCVALYKDKRKRTLFFAGDNNNNSDLYLKTLSMCNTGNQSIQNQNVGNSDRHTFVPAAQHSDISFIHTESREMASLEEPLNRIRAPSGVHFPRNESATLSPHMRQEVITSSACRVQFPFFTGSSVYQPSVQSPPSTPPPSYRSSDSSPCSSPPPSYQEVIEGEYSEPPPAYQQTVLDLRQSRSCNEGP